MKEVHFSIHLCSSYLYLNNCFLTILHSLTLQNTITSLTKTIFRGAHIRNFPSFLPYFHHSSYTILTILFYSHIKFRPQLAIYIKNTKCILVWFGLEALCLCINHAHLLGVCVRAYKTRLESGLCV